MLIRELIQRIQSLYSKGVQSDDSRLTSRHIYNKLLSVRSKLLSQKANKKQKISQWNYQTLPCVELEKAPLHECPCLPPVGCEILKTKTSLPKPLLNLSEHMIQTVTSLDNSVLYSEISWEQYKYKKGNKYTASKPDYFIRNGYLYITHRVGPRVISITGIFEDPLEAEKFPSYCDKNDEDDDCDCFIEKEFPIDNDLIDYLIESTAQELILVFSQMSQDNTNNSKDAKE